MKFIVVLPVKNEDWILQTTLAAFSLWADHIIVADQHSTDATLQICAGFPKVKVIANDSKFHSSNVRKLLLDEARKIPGNNAIFSFDADEVPTAEILTPGFREKISQLLPGTAVAFKWVNVWKQPDRYRDDGSVWSPYWKPFMFVDDGIMEYTTTGVVNDHTSRIPMAATRHLKQWEDPKVLHLQFLNWPRMLAKQDYYRVSEFLQSRKTALDILRINKKYYPTRNEVGLYTKTVPPEWLDGYWQEGVNPMSFSPDTLWYRNEVASWIQQYGAKTFRWLDIWQQPSEDYGPDPRGMLSKFYHRTQRLLYKSIDALRQNGK